MATRRSTGQDVNTSGEGAAESPETSERITADQYQSTEGDYLIYVLHAATYDFARPYVSGKKVLDFGCGTGYGTDRIAEDAEEITGVDISADAIDYARAHYRRDNLRYAEIGMVQTDDLPFAADSFDVVLSFQVVEHIDQVGRYLSEIRRVLRPGGQFLCVTPDRTLRLFPRQQPWNEFHVTEFAPEELESLLYTEFADVRLFGMTASPRVLGAELRRYRRTRILTLPVTFPGLPDRLRLAGVRAIKKLLRKRAGSTAPTESFGFGPEDIVVAPGARPSVNIVAVAVKPGGPAA